MKWLYIRIAAVNLFLISVPATALFAQVNPTSPSTIGQGLHYRAMLRKKSLVHNYPVRSVGPVVMAGRVTDLAVDPDSTQIFYIAYASGGIFKTIDNGISFRPVFDNEGTTTIGDIALSGANPNIIWAGTGEVNSSRSSYAGTGVYKSTDAGKTWHYSGLAGTEHIGRIITHPTNPDIAWVAAEGPLYSNSPDRGVYKTVDGGKTWTKTLFVNDSTGAVDLIINPDNPKQLWAATWTRRRYAWNFIGDGPGSAIYASSDGGNTWHKSVQGLPTGPLVGRIGLTECRSKPNILYAVIDNQSKTEKQAGKKKYKENKVLTTGMVRRMSTLELLKLDNKKLNDFLRHNRFPKRYTPENVKEGLKSGRYTPREIADYNHEGANQAEVNSSVIGAQVYRSDDYGVRWRKVNQYALPGIYYTYGYYFAQIRVNPDNPDDIFILGVPLIHSVDGGRTYHLIKGGTHSDNHAFWFDPANPHHILLGTDGGAYASWDSGKHWIHYNSMAVGQFYSVALDLDHPYHIYGGLQDNGVFYGSSETIPDHSRHWKRLLGGDGMHVAVDTSDNHTVYAGTQFGQYFRIDLKTGKSLYITPKHNIGESPYRWNWNTPIILSPHNQDIVYMGAQKLLRSMDRGAHFKVISPDLTTNRRPRGNVPYSTITTIAESSLRFGLIWVGTDDGNIQLTRDGGVHWKLVSNSLPQKLWVSKIFASSYDTATAFASLTGYRYDEFHPYIYKTTDYGRTWKTITGDLPKVNVNVIIQDPVNPDLLFTGTDHGSFLSFDAGKHWQRIDTAMPGVPTYDMEIQPKDHDLVMATHGRSMYVMSIKPLEKITPESLTKPVIAFAPDSVSYSSHWGKKQYPYMKPAEPDVSLMYYIGEIHGKVFFDVKNQKGLILFNKSLNNAEGFHIVHWNLVSREQKASEKSYLVPGTYSIVYHNGSYTDKTKLVIYGTKESEHEEQLSEEHD